VTCLLVAANVVAFWDRGWPALLVDTLFLLVFGARVEDRFGRIRFVVFYLLCGFLTAYCIAAFDDGAPELAIGAVGAVSGVLGAYLALLPRARAGSLSPVLRFLPERLPAWPLLILWFVLQWFLGEIGPAALGFLVGLFAAVPMLRRRPRIAYRRQKRRRAVSRRSSAGTCGRAADSARDSRNGRGTGSGRGTGGAGAGSHTGAGGA
jgi:membrane associated rhomboid family serine protease